MRLIVLGVMTASMSAALRAQSGAPTDTLAEARRRRDAGEYAAAATILAPYVEHHPEDPGTARFAALMSYWSKDFSAARATYEHALERHPNDADLRVDFARFLLELGETSRARQVITPVVDSGPRLVPATRRALTLLGTLDYWRGDFSRARKSFVEALRLDSTDADARRQVREIEMASAAWVRVGASGWHDDQPLNHTDVEAEGGWFASPLTPLSVRAGSIRFSHDGVSETVSRAEATAATFLAPLRLDISVAGGLLNRTFGDASDWTGRASLGIRFPRSVVLEGRFERAPYLNTTASLATTVMTETLDATLRWRAPSGWMGDATARRETFEDDNAITTGYVWLLAPIVHRSTGELQIGYSFAAQAADHSRFVPGADDSTIPPGPSPESVPGVYDPYYTPRNLRTHSALVAATLRPNPRWSLSGGGSYGFHARDDAPTLLVVQRPPNVDIARMYSRRAFTPWNARAAIEGSATDAVRLALTAEHAEGPFYAFTTVAVRLTYTFIAAARRRADRY